MLQEEKKLLFVGGALFQVPAIACAKRLGCQVILADWNPDVPGREYADIFEKISTADKDQLLEVARRYKIDGVMTYASDSSVAAVTYIAEKMGLPGNPQLAGETIRRKDLFREFQSQNGLPHPCFCSVASLPEAIQKVQTMDFPLVVKPVDSAGTKGQSIIYGRNEVPYAFETALAQSRVGIVILEAFVNTDCMELDGDIWFHEGKLAFRHYGHNHFLKNRISNVPSGEIFPGIIDQQIEEQLDQQFSTIINALGLREGCLNFDGLVSNGIVYIVDAGLRNGGNYVPDLIKLSTGFDLTEAAIRSALGLPFAAPWIACPNPLPVASYFLGSRFHGQFDGYEFDPALREYVVEVRPFIKEGNEIQPFTRSDYAAGIVFFRFPDLQTLQVLMGQIEDLVTLHVSPMRRQSKIMNTTKPIKFKAFAEQISPFLRKKIADLELDGDQDALRVLNRMYVESSSEDEFEPEEGVKHYEASHEVIWNGRHVNGVERLYRRVILFELVQQCAARCRYCLRRNYETWSHSRQDISHAADYICNAPENLHVRELLVTGGDPGIVPDKLNFLLESLAQSADRLKVVRVAPRTPVHQPDLVNDRLLGVLGKKWPFRIEIATHINHAAELFPEVEDAYRRLIKVVPTIYNQAVLLEGINDTTDELVEMCDRVRALGIENHYLFHCVPIGGLKSFRVPLARALDLARQLSQSGYISGRAKPKFALMTSIGKIMLYEGSILDHKDERYLLRTEYKLKDRLEWNSSWQMPPDAFADATGRLCVWYEDVKE
jgi:lysine 2,3-aminomutase